MAHCCRCNQCMKPRGATAGRVCLCDKCLAAGHTQESVLAALPEMATAQDNEENMGTFIGRFNKVKEATGPDFPWRFATNRTPTNNASWCSCLLTDIEPLSGDQTLDAVVAEQFQKDAPGQHPEDYDLVILKGEWMRRTVQDDQDFIDCTYCFVKKDAPMGTSYYICVTCRSQSKDQPAVCCGEERRPLYWVPDTMLATIPIGSGPEVVGAIFDPLTGSVQTFTRGEKTMDIGAGPAPLDVFPKQQAIVAMDRDGKVLISEHFDFSSMSLSDLQNLRDRLNEVIYDKERDK